MPCQASDVEIAAIPSSWYFIVLLLIWRLTAPDPDPLKLSRMSNLASYVYAHEKQTAVLSGGFYNGVKHGATPPLSPPVCRVRVTDPQANEEMVLSFG